MIALAALLPGDPAYITPSQCIVCGPRGIADAILNVMLFMPLGAALAFGGVRSRDIVLAAFAATLTVETLQLFIPGRDASAGDLLFNTLGGLLGSAVPPLNRWARTTVLAKPAPWSVAAAVAGLGIAAAAGGLLRPWFPAIVYYAQWTPSFAHTEQYDGRVLAATLGDLVLNDGRVRRSGELRAQLLAGGQLQLQVRAGRAPARPAPVFNIYDADAREVLSVMADGADLVIRYRMAANRMRLDQPHFRLRGALRGVAAGEEWSMSLRLVKGGLCVRAPEVTACPVLLSIGRGWSVLLYADTRPIIEKMLDLLWLLLLFLPAGLFVTRPAQGVILGALCLAGLWWASAAVDLLPLRVPELAAAVGGLALGSLVRRRLLR